MKTETNRNRDTKYTKFTNEGEKRKTSFDMGKPKATSRVETEPKPQPIYLLKAAKPPKNGGKAVSRLRIFPKAAAIKIFKAAKPPEN